MDSLLYKHLDRLLKDPDLKKQIERLSAINGGPLQIKFIFKYGLDGSSGGPRSSIYYVIKKTGWVGSKNHCFLLMFSDLFMSEC